MKWFFKALFFLFLIFGYLQPLFAQNESPQQRFERANQFYFARNFPESIFLYQQLENSGIHSADLFFNLANSYYRQGEMGEAVYYYMKALRYAPRDRDLVANFKYVLSKRSEGYERSMGDKLQEMIFFLKDLLTLREVLGLALVSYWVLFGMGIVYYLKRKQGWAIVLGILIVFNLYLIPVAFQKFYEEHLQSTAVLLTPTVPVYSEPSAESIRLFELHEGAIAQVKDQREGFMKIRYRNGQTGWVKSDQLKVL